MPRVAESEVKCPSQWKSWRAARNICFSKSFKRNCTISTGIPSLRVWCEKWSNWTYGVGVEQKNPTPTRSVVRNPNPPENLDSPTREMPIILKLSVFLSGTWLFWNLEHFVATQLGWSWVFSWYCACCHDYRSAATGFGSCEQKKRWVATIELLCNNHRRFAAKSFETDFKQPRCRRRIGEVRVWSFWLSLKTWYVYFQALKNWLGR